MHREDFNLSKTKKIRLESVPEDKFSFRLQSPPSLQCLSEINVIASILLQNDIKDLIDIHTDRCRGDAIEIENRIKKKVLLLDLPAVVKPCMYHLIRPMVQEVLKWLKDYEGVNFFNYMHCIRWTIEGVISKTNTFEAILNDKENILCNDRNICYMFNIACKLCLKDSIFKLWDMIPTEKKECHFYKKRIYRCYNYHTIGYWVSVIRNKKCIIGHIIRCPNDIYEMEHSTVQNMFKLSLYLANFTAIKYFWNELTSTEIYNNIFKWIDITLSKYDDFKNKFSYRNSINNQHVDILCFLLSHLSREQQIEMLKKHSLIILKSLLFSWPRQKFLLPILRRIWGFLEPDVYLEILLYVAQIENLERIAQNYLSLFWKETPRVFKKKFFRNFVRTHVVWVLAESGDVDNIRLILKDADMKQKRLVLKDLAESDKGIIEIIRHDSSIMTKCELREHELGEIKNLVINVLKTPRFTSLIAVDDFVAVQNFLEWCLETEHEIKEFKTTFAKCLLDDKRIWTDFKSWHAFTEFLKWCFASEEDLNVFKTRISKYDKLIRIVCAIIGRNHDLGFVDNLLKWVYDNDRTEIKKFQCEFMLSPSGFHYLHNYIGRDTARNTACIRKLLVWITPFNDCILALFKDLALVHESLLFINVKWSVQRQRAVLLSLLDEVFRMDEDTTTEGRDVEEDSYDDSDHSSEYTSESEDVLAHTDSSEGSADPPTP